MVWRPHDESFLYYKERLLLLLFSSDNISTHSQDLSSSPLHCPIFFSLAPLCCTQSNNNNNNIAGCVLFGWFLSCIKYIYIFPMGKFCVGVNGLGQLDSKLWECLGVPPPPPPNWLAHNLAFFFKTINLSQEAIGGSLQTARCNTSSSVKNCHFLTP
jgi:hypothetical protein